MNTDRIALVLGGLTVMLGIVVAIEPGVASRIGTDQAVFTVIGFVAVYLVFRAFMGRRRATLERVPLPEAESKHNFDPPGDSFTDRLRTAAGTRRGQGRETIRDDLYQSTVDVLTTYRDYTVSEAEQAIEDGSWTDNPYAVAFFTFEAPPRSLRDRISDAFRGRVAFESRARHVIAELDDITEEP